MNFGKSITTFFILAGAMTVAGAIYNHFHPIAGFAALGVGVYFVMRYRHWLFPGT